MKWVLGFAAAVIVPGLVLGVIAARSLDREELYLEKQLENTLRAEADQTITSIQREIGAIVEELGRDLKIARADDYRAAFRAWRESSPLVDIPFLVSADNRLIWPRPDRADSSKTDSFLAANELFLSDKATILAYQDIATLPAEGKALSPGGVRERRGKATAEGAKVEAEAANVRQAYFRSSEEVQEELYERAESQRKQVLKRKVIPQQKEIGLSRDEDSVVVAAPMALSEITARTGSGIIPRLADSRLELLFWKKIRPGGEIAGCSIVLETFKKRLVEVLPVPYSATRLLTILDQNGLPLVDPAPGKTVDWKRPFFSREIGAILPHWEVATYLADPAALASQARTRTLVTGIVIAVLLIAILIGGVVIFRSVTYEVALAQQKTTFAANVSHELKTPLTTIGLFAEMLREGRQTDPAKQREYLDLIVSESKRLSRLINNVLDFSRIERGEKAYHREEFDLGEIVRRMVEELRVRLEQNGFRVVFSAPEEEIKVSADPEAIKQVLINLLTNAEKYSEKRKEIEVEVGGTDGEASISIRDRGIGIPPAKAGRIFDKFYRVDTRLAARTRGTGLGLTIARAIVEDHGGTIVYSPRKEGGSRFEIRLPRIR